MQAVCNHSNYWRQDSYIPFPSFEDLFTVLLQETLPPTHSRKNESTYSVIGAVLAQSYPSFSCNHHAIPLLAGSHSFGNLICNNSVSNGMELAQFSGNRTFSVLS